MRNSDLVYEYDGSFMGLLSCVHACIYDHKIPISIYNGHSKQGFLLPSIYIQTDMQKANAVRKAIICRISARALEMIEHVFYSCLEDKEITVLHFLISGFREGCIVTDLMADPIVSLMLDAERHLMREAHLLTGFVRFVDVDGKLIAVIDPKNQVLPLILSHFADRYEKESFLIFDRTHQTAVIHHEGSTRIGVLSSFMLPPISAAEAYYQSLWKQFYHTIAIKERDNPRCRMSHMPKRFWYNLTEMQT
jgi:probable DNA metabolism protein